MYILHVTYDMHLASNALHESITHVDRGSNYDFWIMHLCKTCEWPDKFVEQL